MNEKLKKRNPYPLKIAEIKSVWFCYDSDQAGCDGAEASSVRIFEDFPDRELSVMSCSPVKNKDWNEALQLFRVLGEPRSYGP